MDGDQLAAFIQQQVANQIAAQAPPVPAPVAPVPQPALIKPQAPTAYSGDLKEDVALWLFQVDSWLQAGRVQHELEKVVLATGLLRGPALAWWRTKRQQPGSPTDWASLQEAMLANFQLINPVETFRDQLQDLKQTSTVLDYATTFRNITVNLPTMTDEEMKFRFIHGLKQTTKEQVRMSNPATFEEAVQTAVRFDAIYRPSNRLGSYGYAHEPVPMELDSIGHIGSISSVQRQQDFRLGQQRRRRQQHRQPRQSQRQHLQRPTGPSSDLQGPKISQGLRLKLMQENKCFHCQKTGHLWKDCPSRK